MMRWYFDVWKMNNAELQKNTKPLPAGIAANKQSRRSTKNYMSLPYNAKLKERARNMRKWGNMAEILFWKQVKNGGCRGLDFDRQKIIGNYIVDFYCASLQVVVEIDGSSHKGKEEYDAKRDAFLRGLGLTVIHISTKEVRRRPDKIISWLVSHPALQDREDLKS